MKVSRVSEMRAIDRAAINTHSIDEALLMENAGAAVCRGLAEQLDVRGRTIAILCGGGNNGGDGLVVARHIHSAGGLPEVVLLADPQKYDGAAALNYEIVRRLSLPIHRPASAAEIEPVLARSDAIVDALLGTGITRPVEGLYRQAIEAMNRSGKFVVAVDIPSGINGDTGQVMGAAVNAQRTVTFGLPKIGNLLYPGFEHGGKLCVTHISFPPALYNTDALLVATNDPPRLPPRPPDGHKGSFGQALFIAGAASYYGAPSLAAHAFLRAGGGYSRLAAPASMIPFLAARAPEVVYLPQAETAAKSIAGSNKDKLLDIAADMDFVVLGPGMSLDEETQDLARALVQEVQQPLLIDGDGITAVSRQPELLRGRTAPTILTPHPGEMARLTGLSTRDIAADRVAVLQDACKDLNAIIVLKGAHSLVGFPDGHVYINLSGNSGMGTAGSGDVLTGAIAAMAGQGLTAQEATRLGVFLHGVAGDLAARAVGEDGMTAQTILDYLPAALKAYRSGFDEELARKYAGARLI